MLKSSTIEWFQRGSAGPEIVEWLIADLGIGSTLTAAQMYNKYEKPKGTPPAPIDPIDLGVLEGRRQVVEKLKTLLELDVSTLQGPEG